MTEHIRTSATLVDFPQFPAIHHLLPRVLDLESRPQDRMERNYLQIESSGKWEIYVKYRHIVSQFLTDRTRSLIAVHQTPVGPYMLNRHLFVGQKHYISFAEYLLYFLSENPW